MIEPVGAVGRIDAASLVAAPGASVRQTLDRRQRRLRWLGSLREALGEAGPLIDEMAAENSDEALLAETRERIAAALDTIEEMRGFMGNDASVEQDGSAGTGATVTAAEIAHRIGIGGEALGVQARLGAATVRHLVGDDGAADAVNGA